MSLTVTNEVDLVVVGTGAGGMSTAISAAGHGLSVCLLEKSATWGGSTARSGGGVWIPGNDILRREAPADHLEDARRYLHAIVGDDVSPERIDAYIDRGPEALRFLIDRSELDLHWVPGYSDYLPEQPGGQAAGRSVEPRPFDVRRLGDDETTLTPFYAKAPANMVVLQEDYRWISTGLRTWRGPWHMLRIATRTAVARVRGQRMVGLGNALAGSLMLGVRRAGVPVLLNTAVVDLITEGNRVTGVVTSDGARIAGRRGVVLACGGFDHNEEMRRQYQREPASAALSLGATGNTGDGILAAQHLGAGTALMDDAWWAPSIPLPRRPWFALAERSLPRSLMVNDRGRRFMNESLPYVEATHAMFGGTRGAGDGPAENLPAWLIFDQGYRDRYMFAGRPARTPLPQAWFDAGALIRADSIGALATAIGVEPHALEYTVTRFNRFAMDGVDTDFSRGESAYDHYYGDTSNKPNPSLGPLDRAPYYAAQMVPADLGTKGGLLTDHVARVLTDDGLAIDGLYAVGNTAAAVMGRTYAGPGATIGPALVFGYLAARHAAGLEPR